MYGAPRVTLLGVSDRTKYLGNFFLDSGSCIQKTDKCITPSVMCWHVAIPTRFDRLSIAFQHLKPQRHSTVFAPLLQAVMILSLIAPTVPNS